jgi:hypothetical protein
MAHAIETVVKHKNGYVGICKCCGTFNVAFKNMLFSLTEAEFDWFKNLLTQKEMMAEFRTSHGKELLLTTPIPNYFILLTYSEIGQLLRMMNQCCLVIEARRIVHNSLN